MLSRNLMKASALFNPRYAALRAATTRLPYTQQHRIFSSNVGLTDVPDVFKVNYTEEFD